MNENVIIADASYIDKVAFDLTVNFERMLERRIPQADMARWAECIALDGGLRGAQHTTVILIHNKEQTEMKNFAPGHFDNELNGKAFNGNLGEFCFSTPCGEGFVGKDELFLDTLQTLLQQQSTKRLMVVPDDSIYNNVREILRKASVDGYAYSSTSGNANPQQSSTSAPVVTVFAMQPMPGGPFQQEILGYSLMAALGIRGDELKI